jgi:hypothetical protein
MPSLTWKLEDSKSCEECPLNKLQMLYPKSKEVFSRCEEYSCDLGYFHERLIKPNGIQKRSQICIDLLGE